MAAREPAAIGVGNLADRSGSRVDANKRAPLQEHSSIHRLSPVNDRALPQSLAMDFCSISEPDVSLRRRGWRVHRRTGKLSVRTTLVVVSPCGKDCLDACWRRAVVLYASRLGAPTTAREQARASTQVQPGVATPKS